MDIQLNVNGKPVNATLALPKGDKGPGVLVLHAWWGLNPFFKSVCTRLAEQGFVAFAPDLNNGLVAHSVAEAEALMQARDPQAGGEIVLAAKDFLLAHPACSSSSLGAMGFSMGAGWSLWLASQAPEEVAATVLFYGIGEADPKRIKSKILGHFSPKDAWESYDYVQKVEQDLRNAGVEVTFHTYPGVAHWFVETDRPEYDPAAAKLAWERTFEFLKKNM